MLKEFIIALVGAAALIGIASALGVIPLGNEPIEIPWRITLTLVIGMLIGISAGFVWLQEFQKDFAFSWPILLIAFATGGICAIEINYCQQSGYASINTLPVLLSGTIAVGALIGATVRTLR